jgi:hypothetical protein
VTGDQIIRLVGAYTLEDFEPNDVVAHVPESAQRTGFVPALEFGAVTTRNEEFVFVRFTAEAVAGMACAPANLVNLNWARK